jgi:hypothetical protein
LFPQFYDIEKLEKIFPKDSKKLVEFTLRKTKNPKEFPIFC